MEKATAKEKYLNQIIYFVVREGEKYCWADRGRVTLVDEHGLLHGTWGRFEVDPDRDLVEIL